MAKQPEKIEEKQEPQGPSLPSEQPPAQQQSQDVSEEDLAKQREEAAQKQEEEAKKVQEEQAKLREEAAKKEGGEYDAELQDKLLRDASAPQAKPGALPGVE